MAAVLLLLPAILQEDQIAVLRRLADEDYFVREQATAELLEMGPERAAALLDLAGASRDPEVRARALLVSRALAPAVEGVGSVTVPSVEDPNSPFGVSVLTVRVIRSAPRSTPAFPD